jgi:hypothetical protein
VKKLKASVEHDLIPLKTSVNIMSLSLIKYKLFLSDRCQYLNNWICTNISASTTDVRKVDVADDHMSLKSKV